MQPYYSSSVGTTVFHTKTARNEFWQFALFFRNTLFYWHVACTIMILQPYWSPSLVPRPHPLAYCERGSGDFGPLSWAFEVQVLRNTLIYVVLECNDIAVKISVQTLFAAGKLWNGLQSCGSSQKQSVSAPTTNLVFMIRRIAQLLPSPAERQSSSA